MEHVSLSATTIGSKELVISIARSYDTLIHTNQVSYSIDIRVHDDWEISFRIQIIYNEMSIDFRRNKNDGICVNPSRTIRSLIPKITIMKSGTGIGFGQNNSDGIPPRNIRRFVLFNRGTSDFSDRSTSWHGAAKIESENPEDNRIFKNAGRENNFEVEKLGAKIL